MIDDAVSQMLDGLAAEVLASAEIGRPPVDAFLVAQRLGVEILLDDAQAGRARHKRLAGRPVILLRPDERPERLQWAAAHELGEVIAHRVFERLDMDESDVQPALREQSANLLATRLLLPFGWFTDDVRRVDGDLPTLKAIYRTASHELLAWRLLDLPVESTVTVFDHGRITRRRSNGGRRPSSLTPPECAVWQETHRTGDPHEQRHGEVRIRCWPIHEPGWKREILQAVLDV